MIPYALVNTTLLRELLQVFVEAERYDEAAKVRDEINSRIRFFIVDKQGEQQQVQQPEGFQDISYDFNDKPSQTIECEYLLLDGFTVLLKNRLL